MSTVRPNNCPDSKRTFAAITAMIVVAVSTILVLAFLSVSEVRFKPQEGDFIVYATGLHDVEDVLLFGRYTSSHKVNVTQFVRGVDLQGRVLQSPVFWSVVDAKSGKIVDSDFVSAIGLYMRHWIGADVRLGSTIKLSLGGTLVVVGEGSQAHLGRHFEVWKLVEDNTRTFLYDKRTGVLIGSLAPNGGFPGSVYLRETSIFG